MTQKSLPLRCHPATPATAVQAIEATTIFSDDGRLTVTYRLYGDTTCLRIPEKQSPSRTDNLWQHTCFEAFIGIEGETAYHEFNFSPSGQWAAYAFSDYRQRTDIFPELEAPDIRTRIFPDRLELEASIAQTALPRTPERRLLQIGLSAVVENRTGGMSYWALSHATAKPDFHDRRSFIIDLCDPCD